MQHSPGFLALVEAARARVDEVQAAELPGLLQAAPNAVLIDVREDSEWHADHVRGALHLGKGVIERDIEQRIPDPQTCLYLYCGGGYRSVLAADNLRQMGYQRVYSVDGGWRELQKIMPTQS